MYYRAYTCTEVPVGNTKLNDVHYFTLIRYSEIRNDYLDQ